MFNKLNDHYLGSTYALLSAVGFGLVPIVATYAYRNGIEVFTLVFLRFSFTAALMFIYLILKNKKLYLKRNNLFNLFILGGIIYSFQNMCYFSAIKYIPASMAVLFFYTYPILISIISRLMGEKLNKQIIVAILLSFIGLILVLGDTKGILNPLGVLLAFGAALFYALYAIFGDHVLKKVPLDVTLAYASFFAALVFLVTGSLFHLLNFNFETGAWGPVTMITMLTLFGFLAFFQGIKLTNPAMVAVLSMVEPLVAIILSIILFKDSINSIQGIGMILVLTGAILVFLRE